MLHQPRRQWTAPHTPAPGAIKCKEELKDEEDPPSFKESDDDKPKVEAPQKDNEATMKDAHENQDQEQALSATAAAEQTGEGPPNEDDKHHQEADQQETSPKAKAPAPRPNVKPPCQLPAHADGMNPAETDPPKPQGDKKPMTDDQMLCSTCYIWGYSRPSYGNL